MTRLVLQRLASAVLTLALVAVLVFLATQALPGDAAQAILGQSATPERLAALRDQLNLDESTGAQFVHWLGGILGGDLGTSLTSGKPVSEVLAGRVTNSVFLVLVAAAIALPAALALGVWTAVRRDGALDHGTTIALLTLAALPEFVIGIALILLLATDALHLFPPVSLMAPGEPPWARPEILVLPVATLVLAVIPYVSRIVRGSMIEVLERDYVQMARLKGLPERTIIFRHALPNALAPAIQASALSLAYMTGGVVVVEVVFQYNGIGAALVEAVNNRDVPVVQALVLLLGAVYVGLNLLADVAVIATTPKLRTALKRSPHFESRLPVEVP